MLLVRIAVVAAISRCNAIVVATLASVPAGYKIVQVLKQKTTVISEFLTEK